MVEAVRAGVLRLSAGLRKPAKRVRRRRLCAWSLEISDLSRQAAEFGFIPTPRSALQGLAESPLTMRYLLRNSDLAERTLRISAG